MGDLTSVVITWRNRRWNGIRCLRRGTARRWIVLIAKKKAATGLCTTCQVRLCDFCTTYHQRSAWYNVIQSVEAVANEELIDKKPLRCADHDQEMKYFCEGCLVSICVECMLSDTHRGLSALCEKSSTSDAVEYEGHRWRIHFLSNPKDWAGILGQNLQVLNGIVQPHFVSFWRIT